MLDRLKSAASSFACKVGLVATAAVAPLASGCEGCSNDPQIEHRVFNIAQRLKRALGSCGQAAKFTSKVMPNSGRLPVVVGQACGNDQLYSTSGIQELTLNKLRGIIEKPGCTEAFKAAYGSFTRVGDVDHTQKVTAFKEACDL
jgi:hypothetical protein